MRVRKPRTQSEDILYTNDKIKVMDKAALKMLVQLGYDARKELEKRAYESWEKAHTNWQNAQSRRLDLGYKDDRI